MYEGQGVPTEKCKSRVVTALVGAVLGAGIASGVFWLAMREQETRYQLELDALSRRAETFGVPNDRAGIPTEQAIDAELGLAGPESETAPTAEEIAGYLDGRWLPLPPKSLDSISLHQRDQGALKGERNCRMEKDAVEMETVQQGTAYRFDDGPFTTPIVFVYKNEGIRYAVEADVSHRWVGNKTAFFGLRIKRVARQ